MVFASATAMAGSGFASASASAGGFGRAPFAAGPPAFAGPGPGFQAFAPHLPCAGFFPAVPVGIPGGFPPPPVGFIPPAPPCPMGLPGALPPVQQDPAQAGDNAARRVLDFGGSLGRANHVAEKVAGRTGAQEAAASGEPPQAGFQAGVQELNEQQQSGAGGLGPNPMGPPPFAPPDQF